MARSIRVVTYNIRHGLGIDETKSLERIAWIIFSTRAHLCGLQEVDKHNPRSGIVHQAKQLARKCGMYYAFGGNVTVGPLGYGNAVLSRVPIINYSNHRLPSTGEKRGVLKVEVKIAGVRISFLTTHLGLNAEQRLEQARTIKELIKNTEGKVLLTGDFNEEQEGQAVKLMLKDNMLINCLPSDGSVFTFPSKSPNKHIDFVMADPSWQVHSARVINTLASDHLPYLVELKYLG